MRTQHRVCAALGCVTALQSGPPGARQDQTTRICLAPASVEAATGNATAAMDAARETFMAYLTGPSLRAEPLKARLESQVREEAKAAECPFVLFTTIKLENKQGGGSLLGRMAAGAAQQGALEAGIGSGTTAGRIAGNAAYSAAAQASYNYAVHTRNKDELTLGYRLESAGGVVLLNKRDRQRAKADGEDLLTPLVQSAADLVATAAKRGAP